MGASGFSYRYYVYDLPVSFDDNQYGNFILATKNNSNGWEPICIGEGDFQACILNSLHQIGTTGNNKPTHLHVHISTDTTVAQAEEGDLQNLYIEAIRPNGADT